jgi:hypothetical protein
MPPRRPRKAAHRRTPLSDQDRAKAASLVGDFAEIVRLVRLDERLLKRSDNPDIRRHLDDLLGALLDLKIPPALLRRTTSQHRTAEIGGLVAWVAELVTDLRAAAALVPDSTELEEVRSKFDASPMLIMLPAFVRPHEIPDLKTAILDQFARKRQSRGAMEVAIRAVSKAMKIPVRELEAKMKGEKITSEFVAQIRQWPEERPATKGVQAVRIYKPRRPHPRRSR